MLETFLPEGFICLLTDDGTALTTLLAHSLIVKGWKVVVMSYPETIVPRSAEISQDIPQVVLSDVSEDHLNLQLADISANYGPVGAFIHLNPFMANASGDNRSPINEKTIVKHIFLIAKHLKEPLNKAAHDGRGVFMSVTHLDGEFGLSGNLDFDPISGGLFGLVKTLNLEWEPVFCRALDLDPAYEVENAAERIFDEVHDPNRLIAEVGYSLVHGRQTLVVETISGAEGIK